MKKERKKIIVGFQLQGDKEETWDLLADENLSVLGLTYDDILKIEYSEYYPGDPYTELGIAREHHPAMGSGVAHFITKDNREATIADIWYQDYTPHPPINRPHWNHQRRFMIDGWSKFQLLNIPEEHHQLVKTDYINIIGEGMAGKPDGTKKVRKLDWHRKY